MHKSDEQLYVDFKTYRCSTPWKVTDNGQTLQTNNGDDKCV
jgi:hypothetical protein